MKSSQSKNSVAIIVPCYNYGVYLSDALHSIAAQTFHNWECIIIDDGSTDNTKSVASEYCTKDKRFRYLYQENRGLSNARNTGLQNTKSDFIQFLDADDIIEPRKLEVQVNYLNTHADTDLVYGDARYFDSNNPNTHHLGLHGKNTDWMPRVSGRGKTILKHLVKSNFMVVSAPLFSRQLFADNGYFNEELSSHEDWEFWLRCAINGAGFDYLQAENTNALIRTHKKSMSNEVLNMFISNLMVRKHLTSTLDELDLKLINSERVFAYTLKAFLILWKENKLTAINFFIKHLPYQHGVLAFFGGLIKFNYVACRALFTNK